MITSHPRVSMIWIFERAGEIVRLETCFDSETNEYVLSVFWRGCSESTEKYAHVAAFSERLRALERQLVAERWSQIDNPQITYRRMADRFHGDEADEYGH
jgi:hypothetical protein